MGIKVAILHKKTYYIISYYSIIGTILFLLDANAPLSESLFKQASIEVFMKAVETMKQVINDQLKLYPDLLEQMQRRYELLFTVSLFAPIGRRGIVEQTGFAERYVRNEIEYLQSLQLIEPTTKGVVITERGKDVLRDLLEFQNELTGITAIEEKLKQILNVQKVIVVPGNSDTNEFIKHALGRETVQYLKRMIDCDVTIAVTGGTTMAAVADAMVPFSNYHCLFVPARGGLGERVENQANTIVAKMAHAEKGYYNLLHVPDPLSEALYQSLLEEESLNETLQKIQQADIVLHGIGDALTMAKRRKTDDEVLKKLKKDKAVSEAFGYYFDADGQIVHKVRTFGIQLEDLTEKTNVITVAGGKSKAKAITSYFKRGKSDVLITDEAAATEILATKQ